jgi:hypothetical protein
VLGVALEEQIVLQIDGGGAPGQATDSGSRA